MDSTDPIDEPSALIERAWDEGRTRSTSQTVFDLLTAITNNPSAYKNRWLWELFQNAIDASDGGSLQIKISLTPEYLIFSHTGTPFNADEAVQLIIKGSTKRTLTGKLGRFGTGFITTHFVSKVVDVEGKLKEAPSFRFELDRDAPSADVLGKKMAAAKDQLKTTMKSHTFSDAPYTTRFSYHLQSQQAKNLAKASLDEIGTFLPFVMAFNQEIAKVVVERDGTTNEWQRGETKLLPDGTTLVAILPGKERSESWVAVKIDGDVSAAIKLTESSEKKFRVEELGVVPKLFAAFPLIGTEAFPIPGIVNSREFEPIDDRNGIWLKDAESPEVKKNRPIVAQGLELLAALMRLASQEYWLDLYKIARVTEVPSFDWLNHDWTNAKIARLVDQLETLPLLETVGGKLVAPSNALIPFSEDDDTKSRIWDISSKLFPEVTPKSDLKSAWSENVRNWDEIKGKEPATLPETLTLSKLAEKVELMASLKGVGDKFSKEAGDSMSIVNDMLKLAFEKGKDLFDNYAIIPNQLGTLRKRNDLRHDMGVGEELKNVGEKFGIKVRSKLASLQSIKEVQELATKYVEEDLINEIKPVLKNPGQIQVEGYKEANSDFLAWTVQQQRWDLLEGYPAITIRTESSKASELASLSSKEPLLAPQTRWEKQYSDHGTLFPADKILSSCYDASLVKENWELLSKENFVMLGPLVTVPGALTSEQLEILLSEGAFDASKGHRASADVTTLAFLQSERGVMEIVRGSQERAIEFLDFLLDVMIVRDASWRDPITVSCDCQESHKIYPSLWLFAVRRWAWVPFPSKARRPADAESIARIFEAQPSLQPKLQNDLTSMFFGRMKISITDILKHIGAKNEQAILELEKALVGVFLASDKSVEQLNTLTKVWQDPKYKAEIERMVAQRELVRKNQEVGRTVELLLQELFHGLGIELTKIHRGGDFVNENDFVDESGQVVLKAGNLTIEVKSTTTNLAKMTPAQAEESVTQGPNYYLCVVQLPTAQADEQLVRQNARFVPDIGLKLKPLVDQYHNVESAESVAASAGGDVQLSIEGTLVRFQINEQIWKSGLTIEEFKARIVKAPVAKTT